MTNTSTSSKKEWAEVVAEFLRDRVIDRRQYKRFHLFRTPTPNIDCFMSFACRRYLTRLLADSEPNSRVLTRHDLWKDLRDFNDERTRSHSNMVHLLRWLQDKVTEFSVNERFPAVHSQQPPEQENPLLMAVNARSTLLTQSLLVLKANPREEIGSVTPLQRAEEVFNRNIGCERELLLEMEQTSTA